MINIISGSRRSGRTTALVNLAYDYAREHHGSHILIVVPHQAHVEHITSLIAKRDHRITTIAKKPMRVYLFNGAVITITVPTFSAGVHIDQAYIDDADQIKNIGEIHATLKAALKQPMGLIWETKSVD